MTKIYDVIKSFISRSNLNADATPLNIIIDGEIGSGKTYVMRSLCQKL